MIRGENSEPLPIDLVVEILSRLPAKSVERFRFVSKLWSSKVLRPYFTELFLTRSSARPPRLWFAVERFDDLCFFTSPSQLHDPHDNSSPPLVVAAEFHTKFPGDAWIDFRGHASGLFYFGRSMRHSEEDRGTVICNPSTGQYASLPLLKGRSDWRLILGYREWIPFSGFDPIDKQFKVLSIRFAHFGVKKEPNHIMTLGTGKDSWRKIRCPLVHFPSGEGICIDGVLYYLAKQTDLPSLIVCFDVRSEKFKFIHSDLISDWYDTKMINYMGKLVVITREYERICSLKLCLWVIKDAEKPEPELSKYFSFCWDDDLVDKFKISIVGATATGEIFLSTNDTSKQFYIFYIDPEWNTVQSVEIQGLRATHFDGRLEHRRVQVFVDHVVSSSLCRPCRGSQVYYYEEDICCDTYKPTRREA